MRQPRTHFTPVQSGGDPFSIILDFEALERVYHKLDEHARKRITAIVRVYVWLDEAERKAIPINEVDKFLNRIISTASMLQYELTIDQNNESRAAKDAIIHYLSNVSYREYEIDISDHLVHIEKIKYACQLTLTEVKRYSTEMGLKKGKAWYNMVGQLLKVAYDLGLPRTVSTKSDNLRHPSRFVRLISEIQRQLPNVKSPHSMPDALPKAISLVRAELRKRGILGH
jgi:hypothetical protein